MTPDPRIRRTRKDLGPNWVRREMPIELDILATDTVEQSEPPHKPSAHKHSAHPGSPQSLPPLSVREEGWGRGVRPGRLALASRLPAPSAEDSLPVIPDSDEDLARLPAGHRAFLEQVREDARHQEEIQAVPVVLEGDSGDEGDADEQSTNLYEPFEPEDPSVADMLSMDNQAVESSSSRPPAKIPLRSLQAGPRAGALVSSTGETVPSMVRRTPPSPSREPEVARLAVVRSVSDSIEGEYAGLRATPPSPEPRPQTSSGLDWPPPMERPGIDYPEDWWSDALGGTMVVIDPTRPQLGQGRLGVALVDVGAWVLGFVTMFITGLVTAGSAILVLFALSLE